MSNVNPDNEILFKLSNIKSSDEEKKIIDSLVVTTTLFGGRRYKLANGKTSVSMQEIIDVLRSIESQKTSNKVKLDHNVWKALEDKQIEGEKSLAQAISGWKGLLTRFFSSLRRSRKHIDKMMIIRKMKIKTQFENLKNDQKKHELYRDLAKLYPKPIGVIFKNQKEKLDLEEAHRKYTSERDEKHNSMMTMPMQLRTLPMIFEIDVLDEKCKAIMTIYNHKVYSSIITTMIEQSSQDELDIFFKEIFNNNIITHIDLFNFVLGCFPLNNPIFLQRIKTVLLAQHPDWSVAINRTFQPENILYLIEQEKIIKEKFR